MPVFGKNQRILVRAPNWIGDQILAYPFFHFLRKSYPEAHIEVACMPWVQSVQFRNLVDQVTVLPRPQNNDDLFENAKSWWKGSKLLQGSGKRWDIAISLPNSFSAAILLFLAKAKVRIGYNTDGRGFLLTHAIPWPEKTQPVVHRSEAYFQLLPNAAAYQNNPNTSVSEFWGILPETDLDPGVPPVVDRFDLEKAWPDYQTLDAPPYPYWVLAPGSQATSRKWPIERFAALARLIAQETGWPGLIVGGQGESTAAETLCNDPNLKLTNWTGRGAVASYGKIFRNARFSVCNDSGLAHMAALCGSPVQVIWGAGDLRRTEPMGPGKVQVSLNPVECWPCEKNTCGQPDPERKLDCLKGIYAHSVWDEIKTGLRPF